MRALQPLVAPARRQPAVAGMPGRRTGVTPAAWASAPAPRPRPASRRAASRARRACPRRALSRASVARPWRLHNRNRVKISGSAASMLSSRGSCAPPIGLGAGLGHWRPARSRVRGDRREDAGRGRSCRSRRLPSLGSQRPQRRAPDRQAAAARASGLRSGKRKASASISNTSPAAVSTPSANDSVAVPKKWTCTSPGRRNSAYLK